MDRGAYGEGGETSVQMLRFTRVFPARVEPPLANSGTTALLVRSLAEILLRARLGRAPYAQITHASIVKNTKSVYVNVKLKLFANSQKIALRKLRKTRKYPALESLSRELRLMSVAGFVDFWGETIRRLFLTSTSIQRTSATR